MGVKDGNEVNVFEIGVKELALVGALVVSIATGNSPEKMMRSFGLFEKGDEEEVENAKNLTSVILATAMSEMNEDYARMEKKENGKKENMA